MSDVICENLAHRAGFIVSVGNWIAPNGDLVTGTDYDHHHWETIVKYLDITPETDNRLSLMNQKVEEGYIRLVFRADVMFQVGCQNKEELWGNSPQFKRMIEILSKLGDTEVHIFSKTFYVIGTADNISGKKLKMLQIKEMS